MRSSTGQLLCIVLVCLLVFHSYRVYNGSPVLMVQRESENSHTDFHLHSYGVIGIFSKPEDTQLRNIYRKIFSSAKYNNVLIRFLLDTPGEDSQSEANIQGDILFLNLPSTERDVRFGEKLLRWLKVSMKMFPNAKFVGKMDTDVYTCDATFQFVWDQWSPRMYLGWANDIGWKNNTDLYRMDNMLIIVGNELVQRIINKPQCDNLKKCGMARQLYDEKFDDVSLAILLSEYNDVDVIPINDHVVKEKSLTYVHGMCDKNNVLHGIEDADTLDMVYKAHHSKNEMMSKKKLKTAGVSGSLFKGSRNRFYDGPQLDLNVTPFKRRDDVDCSLWGVVTTINSVTDAIKKAMAQMCVVIVSDKKTPEGAYKNLSSEHFVKLMSVKEQEDLMAEGLEIVKDIPWNHFGRKNIGFLYAIMHGAKKIFDFDDDNILIKDIKIENDWYIAPKVNVFNPCPSYIHLADVTWPRGYPLSEILNTNTWANVTTMEKGQFEDSNIGIVQSLADYDPDVDAIWRLTRKLPMSFKQGIQIMLRPRTMSPCNAQALLHYALWDSLLPIGVPGRVTDIWRCYIGQRLMWDVGQSFGFVSPLVKQIRNSHDYKADFNGELQIYEQTETLLEFLQTWTSSSATLEQRMFDLYVALYEREYIEYSDVILVRSWIRSLKQINFNFPKLLKT